jgi:hypothetical protein
MYIDVQEYETDRVSSSPQTKQDYPACLSFYFKRQLYKRERR